MKLREHNCFLYIMSNKLRRLYTGVTNNLHRRTYQHKHKRIRGFTSEYSFDMLVYYETTLAFARQSPERSRLKDGYAGRAGADTRREPALG